MAYGHNEQWWPKAAKVATKFDKNLPNGNTRNRLTLWEAAAAAATATTTASADAVLGAAAAESLRSSCRQIQRDAAAAAEES